MSSQGKKRSRSSTKKDNQAPRNSTTLEIREPAAAGSQGRRERSPSPVSSPRQLDDDGIPIFIPPPPITNWLFGVREPSPPPEPTAEERELEELWREMERALQETEASTAVPPPEADMEADQEASSDYELSSDSEDD